MDGVVWQVLAWMAVVVLGLIVLYVAARLVSYAFFKTKSSFKER